MAQWFGVRFEIERLLVQDSLKALCFVLEENILSSALVLVQPRKTGKLSRHD